MLSQSLVMPTDSKVREYVRTWNTKQLITKLIQLQMRAEKLEASDFAEQKPYSRMPFCVPNRLFYIFGTGGALWVYQERLRHQTRVCRSKRTRL